MAHRYTAALLLAVLALPLCADEEKPAKTPKPPKPVIAVYNLDGLLSESGKDEPDMLAMPDFSSHRPLTLFDLTLSLEAAADDPEVKAIVLNPDGAEMNLAQIQEIRSALLDAREAGKDVWVYSESLTNRSALLGSAANHFALMPESDCDFSGIHSESLYFKGLLDKVGVLADVIHIGDFKSYGENYYRTGPSEPALRQEEELIGSIFDGIVADVAEGRKLTPDKVRGLIDCGTLTAREAKEAGLADELLYRTGFNAKLRETYGKDADFDDSYELPDLDGPKIKGLVDILKLMFSSDKSSKADEEYVAVVALAGDISDESIEPVRREIIRLIKDEKAKALVLRVDSPGGSAMDSEVLWEATDAWKKTGRPFVVSMGEVAASGGYYVSSEADHIFAEEGTITGSIGVVGMKFVFGGAMEKLGITTHVIQRGKNAGVMTVTRPFSPQEAEIVRKSMTEVYGTFKKRVTDGRGKRLKGDIESLAGGRVYSGAKALETGLVDEIGGLADAIDYAADQADLDEPDVRLLPEPKSMIEGLFSKPDKDDGEIIHVGAPASVVAKLRAEFLGSGVAAALPIGTRKAVSRLVHRLDAFHGRQVLLLAPDISVR
jgi:protease-4